MVIRNQNWEETPDTIQITLLEPYWGAWKQYGWERGIEGLSVSSEAVSIALKYSKKIVVVLKKYGSYIITPTKALKYGKLFTARDYKKLYCIPRTAFKKLPSPKQYRFVGNTAIQITEPEQPKQQNIFQS